MSQEVDQRVVEMRFDNAKFEKNVQQTLNSLNRLNESLQFEGAQKGFEQVEQASEHMDFDKAVSAVEALSSKFSAMEVIGVTALVKITNQAIDAGQKLVKSLSVDNITAGWNKYAQKTASVQTIVNATGKSINKVNGYLDKLMWYSDETNYGFTDMTQSLGQLTAAGGDIDKLIPMILGIANATAYAGKGASEFSRVIYNLNQSYSQGYLNLMDWKSVELAGVATAELKKQIIATGVELGKIKEGDVTVGTFQTTLAKKWADKEVMETAFGKLAEFTEAVKDAVDKKLYKNTADAIEGLADQYDEVTVKAFKAAQEAKSFSEAIDATKEAVGSKWLETFEIIFGSYDEAKQFWTDMANDLWDIFAAGGDTRNDWLRTAFDSGLNQLMTAGDMSGVSDTYSNMLEKMLVDSGRLTDKDIEEAGTFNRALESAGVTAEELFNLVESGLASYERLNALSDAELAKRNIDRKDVETIIQKYSDLAGAIEDGTINLDEFAEKMGQMSGREHFFAGVLNILEGIKSVMEPISNAFNEVFRSDGSPLYKMLEGFDNLTGNFLLSSDTAELLERTFRGLFSVLDVGLKIVRSIGRIALLAIHGVLNALSPVKDLLLNVTGALGDVLTFVDQALGQAQSLDDVLYILDAAIGRILEPIGELWNGFKTFLKTGSIERAKSQFKTFGTVIDTVSSALNRFCIGGVSLSDVLSGAVTVLGGILYTAFNGVGALIDGAFGAFQSAGSQVEKFKSNHLGTVETIRDTVVSLPERILAVMKDFGGTIAGVMSKVTTACSNGLNAIKDFFQFKGIDIYRLLSLLDVGALAYAIGMLASSGKSLASMLGDPLSNLLDSMRKAVDAWTKAKTTTLLSVLAKNLAISIGIIAGSVYLLSKVESPEKAAQALTSILAGLFGVIVAMRAMAGTDLTGIATAKIFTTLTSVALGIVAICGSMQLVYSVVKKFGEMQASELEQGFNAMASIALMMTACIGALSLANGSLSVANKFALKFSSTGAGSFILVAGAMDLVAIALAKLADVPGEQLEQATKCMKTIALALSGCVLVLGVAEGLSGRNGIVALAKSVATIGKLAVVTAALSALAGTMVALTGVIAAFSLMKNLGKGMMAAGAVLASLVAAIWLLSKHAPETAVVSGAMLALSGALLGVAAAVRMLANLSLQQIAQGIIAVGLAMLVLVGGAALLPAAATGVLSVAASCLALATALLILTPAFKGLASLTVGEAFAGILGMVGILGALLVIGTNPAMETGMAVLSASLINLGKAFSAFAGGLIKLGIASAIFSVLAVFAKPICQAIISAEPDIEEALISLINGLCNVIIACAQPIGMALEELMKVLIQVAIDMIGWAWDGNGEGGGIKKALEDLWANIKAWIKEKITIDNPFDISSWIDTFFSRDRAFGKLNNGLTEPFLAPFGTDLDSIGKDWIAKMNGTGEDIGTNLAQGMANGVEENADASKDASGNMAQGAVDATAEAAGVQSPSWKTHEIGYYMAMGLAEGIEDPGGLSAVANAATTLSTTAEDAICDYWGIHSPSILAAIKGFFISLGLGNGISSEESQQAVTSATDTVNDTVSDGLDGAVDAAKDKGEEAAQGFGSGFLNWIGNLFGHGGEVSEGVKNAVNGLGTTVSAASDNWNPRKEKDAASGLKGNTNSDTKLPTDEDWWGQLIGSSDTNNSGGTNTGKSKKKKKTKSSSSAKQKTVAEQIAEKYKTQLAANKTLKDTVDEEYDLWLKENQYSASVDELLAKKTENAAADIQHQTDRVAIAQAKYDELAKRWGADKTETKEAYLDLLQEKTSLADLKAEQYVGLFDDVTKRYNTDLDTLEKEYGLWTAQNDKTATKTDKINRETEYMTAELAIKEKKLAKAQEQYDTLKAQYGEEDMRTMEAWNNLLDARTEAQELQNDLAQQELNLIDAQIDAISTAQSRMQSRMDILNMVYSDGDLSQREDAYKSAVEEYGKDSKQAKKAQFQGTTTSILGVVTALKNMNFQLKETAKYQEELAKATPGTDAYNDAESSLLSSQSAFLGFASNLAEAFNLEDEGKSMVVKLAYAVQKNWKPLSDGLTKAWNKASQNLPENVKTGLSNAFGAAFSDEGIEIGTEFTSAIVSALQGDWAGAAVSAVTAALDFMSTNEGKKMLEGVGQLFDNAVPMLQQDFGQIVGIVQNAGGEIIGLLAGAGGISEVATGVVGTIGGAFSSLIGLLPEIWPFILAGGIILALLGGIAAIAIKHAKDKKQSDTAKDAGSDLDKDFADGITDGKDTVDDAIKDMTDDATNIAIAAVGAIKRVTDDEYEYTPTISPVVDLTDVDESTDIINRAFDNVSLDGGTTKRLAAQVDAAAELQNGVKAQSNADLLNAVNALGGRMDGVADSIHGMSVVVDGKTTIGWIDAGLGARAARRAR